MAVVKCKSQLLLRLPYEFMSPKPLVEQRITHLAKIFIQKI